MNDRMSVERLGIATNPQSRIVLDMEAISLLTRENWLFSRFDIEDRVYIFHSPETGEKCLLYVVGDDDMFISAEEMTSKMPHLKASIEKITFTSLESNSMSMIDSADCLELVITHPDIIEHDLFFIVFSMIDYFKGGSGYIYNQQDNSSDAIYDLKRYTAEKIKQATDEKMRFFNFWQKLAPYLEIFMTRSKAVSIQEQLLKQLSNVNENTLTNIYSCLQNMVKVVAEKIGLKPDFVGISQNDFLRLSYAILDSFKKPRYCRVVASENSVPLTVSPHNSYYQKLKDPENYPVPNKKAMEVYFISCREDTDYGELVESIREDPALTAKILKYLNTPMFRTLNNISTISIEALSLFGLPRIKEIALNVAVDFRDFEIKCEAFDYRNYYHDSLACAIAARNITSYVNKTNPEKCLFTPEQAYTVGLLSQVGKLAFAAVCPQPYNRMLLENSDGGGLELCEMEKMEFGIDHCDIAAEMLSEWNFPDSFCKAIKYQYSFPDNQEIFKNDPLASAMASKLKAAGFMLRWSRSISSTVNSNDKIVKKHIVDTLDKAGEYGICPGNYHKHSVNTQKEWRTMKSVMDV